MDEQITNEELFNKFEEKKTTENTFAGVATPEGETRTSENTQIVEEIENDVKDSVANTNLVDDGFDYEIDETLSTKESEDIELKPEDVGKVLEITEAVMTPPKTKDSDGNFIPPKPFNPDKADSKVGYKSKLKLTLKVVGEDQVYTSYQPSIKWFINTKQDGTKTLSPWFGTSVMDGMTLEQSYKSKFTSEITKIYFRMCEHLGIEFGKLSQDDFKTKLVGSKVNVVDSSDVYKGKTWHRVDIVSFV